MRGGTVLILLLLGFVHLYNGCPDNCRMETIRIDIIPNGHHPEWTPSRLDTIPNAHDLEWTQSRMDTISNGNIPNIRHPKWTPFRMDTIPNAHDPECARF